MASAPLPSTVETAPTASWSPPEMEYCHRVSAYLGLSMETMMSMVRTVPYRSKIHRDQKRGLFETARPKRMRVAG